jgi:hypothetical protein
MEEILTVNNNHISSVISNIFPEKRILTSDAIIAGGFPLAVFLEFLKTKDEFYELLQKNLIKENIKYNSSNKKAISFTDYDIWLKNNHSNDYVKMLFAMKKHVQKKSHTIKDTIDDLKAIFEESQSISEKNTIGNLRIVRISKWAHTFYNTESLRNIQLIKHTINSAQELISSFDLNICKVAWNDGVTYYSSEAINDFKNSELNLSSNFTHGDLSFTDKLYLSLRYKKYATRYDLQPSEQICEFIFKTLVESSDEINLKYSNKFQNTNPTTMSVSNFSSNNYDGFEFPSRMYSMLVSENTYNWFSSCKNFKKEWNLFLLNNDNLKHCIEKTINPLP